MRESPLWQALVSCQSGRQAGHVGDAIERQSNGQAIHRFADHQAKAPYALTFRCKGEQPEPGGHIQVVLEGKVIFTTDSIGKVSSWMDSQGWD